MNWRNAGSAWHRQLQASCRCRSGASGPTARHWSGDGPAAFLARSVDPLPQALVLTSIVIGLGVTIFAIALCIRIYEKYGTYDITEIRRLKG